jgi:hypothetical protein
VLDQAALWPGVQGSGYLHDRKQALMPAFTFHYQCLLENIYRHFFATTATVSTIVGFAQLLEIPHAFINRFTDV